MDAFTTFELIGVILCIALASILLCIVTYACNLMWIFMLPCRGLIYCCRQMQYDNEDHQTCGCCGNNIVV